MTDVELFILFLIVIGISCFCGAVISYYYETKKKQPKYDCLKITYKAITGKKEDIFRDVIYYTIENEDLIIITDEGLCMIELDSISHIVSVKGEEL